MVTFPAADRLSRWRNHRLSLFCLSCSWSATPPVSVLAAEMCPETTLAEAAGRLRCRSCGDRPEALELIAAPAA